MAGGGKKNAHRYIVFALCLTLLLMSIYLSIQTVFSIYRQSSKLYVVDTSSYSYLQIALIIVLLFICIPGAIVAANNHGKAISIIILFLVFAILLTICIFCYKVIMVATASNASAGELLGNGIKNYKTSSLLMDQVQTYWQCCGSKDYKDYKEASIEVPQSCCIKTNSNCKTSVESEINQKGCIDDVASDFKWKGISHIIMLFVLIITECVMGLTAFYWRRKYKLEALISD